MSDRKCEQACSKTATVYAIDPIPGGWGGHYCDACAKALGFRVVDRLGCCADIEQRDALLLSIDRVIYTALGKSWTAGQHVKLKATLIGVVDLAVKP
jgi:hypothetical protein